MAHPTWLAYSFAVLMVSVSLYCIGRLAVAQRLGRRNHIAVNVSHVLMGAAMVGMLVPRWKVLPDGIWEFLFGVLALYFLAMTARSVRGDRLRGTGRHVHHSSHNLIHMVMSCAMLYMYWLGMPITGASDTSMSMSGPPTGAGDPSLTLILIAVLLASAVWQLDSISQFSPRSLALSSVGGIASNRAGDSAGWGEQPLLAPRLEIGCHIAMCLTMGYMLVLMV